MYPGRRPYPDPTHMLKEATESAQCRRVGGARKGALDAVYRTKRVVPRQEQHSRSGDEDHPKPEDRGTCLSLLRYSHGETNVARDSVPGAQKRNDAISADSRKDNVVSVHECRVHARIVHTLVMVLASLEPGKGGRVVLANEVLQLNTQQGKEDGAEVLGVVRCTEEAKAYRKYSATKASLSSREKPASPGSRRVARVENWYSVGARLR
eukprot:6213357-Pleurochrysis_carterae.AAC.3